MTNIYMVLAVLAFAFQLSTASGEAPMLILAGGDVHGPRVIAVYPVPAVAGCTPILEKLFDGTIVAKGCPTPNCGVNNACQAQTAAGGSTKCGCQGDVRGFVLCEGVVTFHESGLVNQWDCFKKDCGVGCTKMEAPADPGEFYACDC